MKQRMIQRIIVILAFVLTVSIVTIPASAYENHCWNCKSRISSDFCQRCSSCGWYICTECGACNSSCKLNFNHGNTGKKLANEISVYDDGRKIQFDVSPRIINNRTMVPMRAIFEDLGLSVTWNGTDRSIYATDGTNVINMYIGKSYFLKNGKSYYLDSPAVIVNGRTLVPVRAISESLGARVKWDNVNRNVIITSHPLIALANYFENHGYYDTDVIGPSYNLEYQIDENSYIGYHFYINSFRFMITYYTIGKGPDLDFTILDLDAETPNVALSRANFAYNGADMQIDTSFNRNSFYRDNVGAFYNVDYIGVRDDAIADSFFRLHRSTINTMLSRANVDFNNSEISVYMNDLGFSYYP